MNISKVTVLINGPGTDIVYVKTDLPPAMYPWGEPVTMKFEAAKGTGKDYAYRQFIGIQIEIIDRNGS